MRDIIIVVATKEEAVLAQQRYETNDIIVTGVGGVNVVSALKNLKRDTDIINFGFAGSSRFPIGTIVEVGHVEHYHPRTEYNEGSYDLPYGDYTCLTSDEFVTAYSGDDPVVFDMELAYICALGFKNIKSVKIVSDNLSEKEYEHAVNSCEPENT